MYIVWTKQKIDGQYVLFAKNTLDELKEVFLNFLKQNEDEYDLDTELIEEELKSFSLYSKDDDFYYSNIENVDATDDIYVFTFHEDGEGGSYYSEIYFDIANKEELLDTAKEFFINESAETTEEDINKMLNNLETNGVYEIPHGRTYSCDMKLFKFKSL
jgi:hypothetical protein